MMGRRPLTIVGIVLLAFGSLASAQRIFVGGGGGSRFRPRFATKADFDGSFLYCRGFYRSVRGEGGGQGWGTDYPGADNNFSIRLAELTRVPVKWDPTRQPIHVVVRLDDPLLNRCPMLFMEDVGTLQFSATEVLSLRRYLKRADSSGWTTSGAASPGRDGLLNSTRAASRSSIRSSTCRFRIRSCIRCTT